MVGEARKQRRGDNEASNAIAIKYIKSADLLLSQMAFREAFRKAH